jgi:pimeloyl-ACP methyl ester carboxylesterase
VGLWDWSQGTWPASAVAARRPELIAFLVLVATSGVSPAVQMRYGTAQQLLLHGYGDADPAELGRLREALESAVCGHIDRRTAQAVIERYADRRCCTTASATNGASPCGSAPPGPAT